MEAQEIILERWAETYRERIRKSVERAISNPLSETARRQARTEIDVAFDGLKAAERELYVIRMQRKEAA